MPQVTPHLQQSTGQSRVVTMPQKFGQFPGQGAQHGVPDSGRYIQPSAPGAGQYQPPTGGLGQTVRGNFTGRLQRSGLGGASPAGGIPVIGQRPPPAPPPKSVKGGHKALVGKTLGGFTLDSFLGKGAHGWVFKASHPKARVPLAVKVVPQSVAHKNPVILKRLEREGTILRSVQHPNLVRIFGHGQQDGFTFLAMEFIEGQTLGELIADWSEPQIDQGITLLRQVLQGLGRAHESKVVHRDLKPDNIMVSKAGVVKIMDFGLARHEGADEEEEEESENPGGLTIQGEILGTPHYMSPEQAEAEEIDRRADIYALGATFYHVFCGSVPFDDKRVLRIVRAHLNKKPQPPSERNHNIPPELEAILLKMLAKKREDRQQTCSEILKALEPFEAAEVHAAEPTHSGLHFPEPALRLLAVEGIDEGWLDEKRVLKVLKESGKLERLAPLLKQSGYVPADIQSRVSRAREDWDKSFDELLASILVDSELLSSELINQERQSAGDGDLVERLVHKKSLAAGLGERVRDTAKDQQALVEDMIFGKMAVRKALLNEQQYLQVIKDRSSKQRLEDCLLALKVSAEDIEHTKRDTIRYMLKKALPKLKAPRVS